MVNEKVEVNAKMVNMFTWATGKMISVTVGEFKSGKKDHNGVEINSKDNFKMMLEMASVIIFIPMVIAILAHMLEDNAKVLVRKKSWKVLFIWENTLMIQLKDGVL